MSCQDRRGAYAIPHVGPMYAVSAWTTVSRHSSSLPRNTRRRRSKSSQRRNNSRSLPWLPEKQSDLLLETSWLCNAVHSMLPQLHNNWEASNGQRWANYQFSPHTCDVVERLPDKCYGVGTNTFVRIEVQSASTKLNLMQMRCTITCIFRMFIFILDMYEIQEQTVYCSAKVSGKVTMKACETVVGWCRRMNRTELEWHVCQITVWPGECVSVVLHQRTEQCSIFKMHDMWMTWSRICQTYRSIVGAPEVREPVLEDLVGRPLAALVLGMPLGAVPAPDVIQRHRATAVNIHLVKRLVDHVLSTRRQWRLQYRKTWSCLACTMVLDG